MTVRPVISRNGWEMQASKFPDRKKLALTIAPVGGVQTFVLGYFSSNEMAEVFEAFLNGDVGELLRRRMEGRK